MSLSDAAVDRLTTQMQGVWQTMTDAKLRAYSDWLLRRCPAAEADVRTAIDELAESSDRIPAIKTLRDRLAAAGAIADAPLPGTGDPRLVSWHKQSALEAAQSMVRVRGLDLDVALEDIRVRTLDDQAIDTEHQLGSAGTYIDRLTAIGELQRERGGRRPEVAPTQEAM